MRMFFLLAAAVSLLFAPPAFAGDKHAEHDSVCRVPDIELSYDTETFTTLVSLPASGCRSREHTIFRLTASISRLDHGGGRDVAERSTECGPFRSADDFESDQEPPRYFCNLAVWIDHPTIEENVQYDVEVTYPGAATERTAKVFTFCSSNGKDASCEH
ncbi:MAG: hypothetical protein AB1679_01520 [Actinomycetota bacterium]|jgi:hypothetical protein